MEEDVGCEFVVPVCAELPLPLEGRRLPLHEEVAEGLPSEEMGPETPLLTLSQSVDKRFK